MNQRITLNKYRPLEGALDFSRLLDKPAGCHGYVTVKDGHLYFEDGTRAKFIGFNFPVRSAFPDRDSADAYAVRLAGLGCNVVRIHAADIKPSADPDSWATEPDAPLLDYEHGTTRRFDPRGLDRLDYFISKLKENGIYVHLDLYVARGYMPLDGTDYGEAFPQGGKGINIFNRTLRELQKEFAKAYLTHVNPYTGLSYVQDPCVMAVQLLNEDSVFFIPDKRRDNPRSRAYYEELRRRFNRFLLAKYDTERHLREAWTENGICALLDGEDPEKGTVRLIGLDIDDMWPNLNDPAGSYEGLTSPARYADFNEFGIMISRDYYGEMIHFLRSIGVKVPIACSNLVHGAADVYCQSDADLHENNGYWNHPFFGEVPDPRDMISTDPRFFGIARPPVQAGHPFQQHAEGVMKGKPFMVTEWNEYGSMPYHSASIMMTAAYACLQDWDGLILYCYQTQGKSAFDQPDDFVANIMESYNDPAVICQHGAMAALFLKGLISPALHTAQVCFTRSELLMMPPSYPMLFSFLPYIMKTQTSFLDHGDAYTGDDEIVFSGGYSSAGDFTRARHAVVFSASPCADGYRRYDLSERFRSLHTEEGAEPYKNIGHVGNRMACVTDRGAVTDTDRLNDLSDITDYSLKKWGILEKDRGLLDGRTFVSDTGEIRYTPQDAFFTASTEDFFLFAGEPRGELSFGGFTVRIRNSRMTFSAVAKDGGSLSGSGCILITAVGACGNDESHFEGKKHILKGKLSIDSLEAEIFAPCAGWKLYALDPYGKRLCGIPEGPNACFNVDGTHPSANFELTRP